MSKGRTWKRCNRFGPSPVLALVDGIGQMPVFLHCEVSTPRQWDLTAYSRRILVLVSGKSTMPRLPTHGNDDQSWSGVVRLLEHQARPRDHHGQLRISTMCRELFSTGTDQ